MPITINGSTGIAGVDGSAATPAIQGTDTNTGVTFPAADTVAVSTGGSERMRVDSSGRVGIGTSAPTAPLTVVSPSGGIGLQINGRTSDNLGGLYFYANNGTTSYCEITATSSEYRVASQSTAVQTFYTNGSERARILSGGNFLIGTTANSGGVNGFEARANAGAGNYAGAIVNTKTDNATATSGFLVKYTGVSPNDTNLIFLCQDSGNTNRFYVQNNGTTGGSSDANLKTNIVDATPKLNDLMNIKVRNFEWIGDQSHTKCLGVIAQEVEDVFPGLVKTEEDGTKTVKHSVFVPILIKALQEVSEKLDAANSRIAALEAK